MSKSIKLSPKHGVNPCIPVCFWCGEPKNEVVLLGKIGKEDSEAPRHLVINYEPCDKCKEAFNQGIHIVGATETPTINTMPPIAGNEESPLYPTGSSLVVSPEFIERMLTENGQTEIIDKVLETKKLVMPEKFVLSIIKDCKKLDSNKK